MKNMFPYIFDYISIIFENVEIKKYVKRIILFGSVATGEHDKESDIDLFIDVPKNKIKRIEKIIKYTEKRFYTISKNKWSLSSINNPIKCIIGGLQEPRWKEIKSEIISTGILLYGKFEVLPKKLSHYSLFTYSLSRLQQKEKMKFLRKFFGYKSTKEGKEYIQEGFLIGIGGKKLTSNSLLIPVEKSRQVQKLFNLFKITPEIREVWIKRS